MDYGYKNALLKGDFQCFFYETEPPPVTLHEHDFCELLLFLGGDVTYHIEGRGYRLKPGDLVIVRERTLHQPYFRSDVCYRRIVVWVKVQYLRQMSTERTDLLACFEKAGECAVLSLTAQERARFEHAAQTLISQSEGYGGDITAQCALMELLLLANLASFARNGAKEAGERTRFEQAISLMRERYDEPLTLDALSASCYLSKYHFSRAFKKEFGITAYGYLSKIRLAEAKRLIPSGLCIAEIANRCGFADYNTFLKAFKREYGTPPTTFLKMVRENVV